MSKIVKKKQQGHALGYRLRNLLLSVLATPLNLLAIVTRIMWSTRRLRLASIAMVLALTVTAIFRITPLQPVADYLLVTAHNISRDAGFRVDDITVEGRQRTQRADLIAAIQVSSNTPIFAIDLDAIHDRVRDLPWVGDVVIIRRLPNILHITLSEREPFALYRENRKLTLIDREGARITGNHLNKFSHQPAERASEIGIGQMHRATMVEMQCPAPLTGPLCGDETIANNWKVGQRVHQSGGTQACALTRELRQMREFI